VCLKIKCSGRYLKPKREGELGILQGVSFKMQLPGTIHEPLHAQNDETDGVIEFMQLYPILAADALFETSQLFWHLKCCYCLVFCCLALYLSRFALLKASQTAAAK
jgi:hypothetical protein